MGLISIGVAVMLSVAAAHVPEAFARAGGGGGRSGGSSMGSRGSRSTIAPAQPAPATPTAPNRSVAPAPAPVQPARPSFFRGIMGGLAGFALGGLLGSLLFGHGFGGFGGIGMLDILLIGGAIALLIMFLRRRRSDQPAPAYAETSSPFGQPAYAMGGGQSGYGGGSTVIEMEQPAQLADLERGLGHIRQMDASFDPDRLVTWARGVYLDVQNSMKSRDLSGLRDRLTAEIATELQAQCDRLRGARQTNVVERIDLRRVEITEAWQETGRDYVTIYFAASMLDYTVDDSTGAVVQGSKSEPQDIEDFWTFSRPVGRGPWQLSAIQNV
jgi:predicted lipid-binding transport protein (Tim44 family)